METHLEQFLKNIRDKKPDEGLNFSIAHIFKRDVKEDGKSLDEMSAKDLLNEMEEL